MTNEEAVSIAKSEFIKIGKGVLFNALSTYIPFFKIPPFSTIANMVIEKALNILANDTETGIFFLYINFHVDAQGRAFMEAAIANTKVQKEGTDAQKKQAEENLKNAFRALIRFSS